MHRSEVLSRYFTSSLLPAYVADPVVALRWWRRRDKVLVMTVYNPSYLFEFSWVVD